MTSFEEYKSKVSIIQVAESLGYKLDPKAGKVSPVFKLTDGNGNKTDEIVINNPNNPSNQYYFDRNYKGGDVIKFIKNHIDEFPSFHHSNSFVQLNKILSHFSNIPYEPSKQTYKEFNEKTVFDKSRYQEKQTSLNDLLYLTKERNISPSTVNSFLPFIKRAVDIKSNADYTNIAFPYVNPQQKDKGTTNYEFRNYGFKGMAVGGDKTDSVWVADFTGNSQLAKHIYFGESAIDLMSYAQLNKANIKFDDSVFVSVGGYISINQLKNTVNAYPNAKIHTCFDNDINGHIYDIKVHNFLANKDVSIKVQKTDSNILFKSPNREFSIPFSELSIERFRNDSGIYAPMLSHKAKGFNDFNDILRNNPNQSLSHKL